ncbi:MAG: glucose/galactose MFS transporter, partial [Cyclobacteriaceae bacterium]|nr:glucose/galactose MFS transporter [Cyclobacteriaceae bacterium]
GPYVGVALLLLVIWLVMLVRKMPTAAKREGDTHWLVSLRRLLQNRNYRWGVTAQFFYVGAQIGVWSYTIRYIMQELGVNESQGANYYLGALALFMVSRFAFTGLLKYFSAIGLLTGSAVAAMFFTLIVIGSGGYVGAIALVAISGCMSLMFPTIFGLAVRGTGDDRKLAGSGLIMAILGGAVMTAIQGQISDYSGRIELSFVVPLLCFFVVVIFGLISKKQVS